MLFMSEEGSEQGGLIWGASQLPDGTIENHGHLSLDQYEENQVFALDAGQEGKDKFSQITIADQGDYPIEEKRRAEERIVECTPKVRHEIKGPATLNGGEPCWCPDNSIPVN